MSRRIGMMRRAGWVFVALAVYLLLGGTGVVLASESGELIPGDELIWLIFAPYVVVGSLVATSHPRNAVGWLLASTGLLYAALLFAEKYAIYGLVTAPGSLPFAGLAAWFASWSWIGMFGSLLFAVLLFPTGRPTSPRWRPVAWASGAVLTVAGIVLAFSPSVHDRHPQLANPLGVEVLQPIWELVDKGFWVIYLVLLAFAVASVVARFRGARGVERQQMKWAVAAFVFAVVLMAVASLMGGWLSDIGWIGAVISIPAALGIAILRYRLYEIDVIIRRTLVYATLTAMLALTYWSIMVVLQQALHPLTGGSGLVVALSTLAAATLFQPLRQRIQRAVDRRFYRHKYDASRTLEVFSHRLRDEIDLEALSIELRAVVQETMQPVHVSMWLRPAAKAGDRRI